MHSAVILLLANVIVMPSVMCSPAARQANFDMQNSIPTFEEDLIIVSRGEWQARAPASRATLVTPVNYVVIHHTFIPGACNTTEKCKKAMKGMQNFHMDGNHWADIGYNFCVGGDGKIYEGRGWNTIGAHAGHSNSVSQGICLIGDWTSTLPPQIQIDATKTLIRLGVALGFVKPDYVLLGHRQVRDTECPGDALFREISNWKHFSPYPRSPREPISLATSYRPTSNTITDKSTS